MTRKTSIIVSIFLIITAVLIEIFLKGSKVELDTELVGFFQGAMFGGGFVMLLSSFFNKKKK
jgi:hypothetical protein